MLLPLLEVFVGIFSNSSSCSQYGANETVIIGILPRQRAADGLSQVVILFQSFIHLGKMKNQNNLIRYVELNVNMYVQGDVYCLFSASRTKPRFKWCGMRARNIHLNNMGMCYVDCCAMSPVSPQSSVTICNTSLVCVFNGPYLDHIPKYTYFGGAVITQPRPLSY